MDEVKKVIKRATELTAISVSRLIKDQGFTPRDVLTEEESLNRERLIDQAGADAMYAALTDIPFVLEVVGSEGRKHIHQYGEALPTLKGVFGSGKLKLDCVNDVVEGSKAAKLNIPGAMSVMAVASHKGLMGTPSDIDYMDKLFGPSQLKGKISIKNSVEDNLKAVIEEFGVKPSEINVVIMDRERNAHYINACQKFGVNLILIKAGDFIATVFACIDPKTHKKGIYLVMGSGGFEEGVMAAVCAKALDAACEGRGWAGDEQIQKRYTKVWSCDDIVSGKDCLLSVSFITDENLYFNLSGVKEKNGGYEVTTLTADSSGVKIINTLHH